MPTVSTDLGSRTAVPSFRGHRLRLSPHASAPDPADLTAIRRWVRASASPTAIDLFCGAGGLSLGLSDAGFTVLVGADNDPFAVETHTANIGGLGYIGDLGDPADFLERLDAWGIDSVDLVAGGPPCQPFSRAGRSKIRQLVDAGIRMRDDPRAEMWLSFVSIVERLRPRAVLLENVPDLAVWDEGAVLTGFRETLRELGYSVDARILDAFAHGVPQHRMRLFIVAVRDAAEWRWPVQAEGRNTLWMAIGDLPVVQGGQREERIPYHTPLTPLQRWLRRGLPEGDQHAIWDHITRDVRPDDAEAFALLQPGQTYADLPDHLRRYRSDIFTDKYKRLEWDGLSRSITAHIAKDGYWYIHPEQDRTLSVREAARVQTFPDRFRFAGQPSHRFRQIGNAVPPLLAMAVGLEVAGSLKGRRRRAPVNEYARFRADLLRWHAENRRSYPWREGVDAWAVLMAEVCLRRTRADQVTPVFEALRRLAPTPAAMISRSDDVMEAMRSLGLRWRAQNLIDIAEALVDRFDGAVPDNEADLRSLPGVGSYVALAVLTFGFDRRAVLVDTNTSRIVSRISGHGDDRLWQVRLDLHKLAGSDGPDGEFNYALLDLGALVCKATNPMCDSCPVMPYCAHGQDVVETTDVRRLF